MSLHNIMTLEAGMIHRRILHVLAILRGLAEARSEGGCIDVRDECWCTDIQASEPSGEVLVARVDALVPRIRPRLSVSHLLEGVAEFSTMNTGNI